ncbi:MAG: TlpA family protein disulfide reductase [Acidobacteria bacterium]|nr:TlpA family protein disulfide reductase [Acidobacteriota bacterium]
MNNLKKTLLVIVILASFFVCQLVSGQTISNIDLSFKSLNNETINLNQFRGQVLVISFSAKGIPLAQIELPQLERLATKFSGQDVKVIWISTNSLKPKASSFASNAELQNIANQYSHLTVLRDIDGGIFQQTGSDTLPTIFILDKNGRSLGRARVGIDPQANLANDLFPIINQALSRN